MKLTDVVAEFLRDKGVRHVFAISGGASLHLIHSIAKTCTLICPQHEQGGSFMADAYARMNGLGCMVATSGPGATNLITGIANSWYDSIPVFYITGQVATFRMVGDKGIRQMGFQETPIVEMVRPITKYAEMLKDPKHIAYMLNKAWLKAITGRPGPVLIDIPDDLQRADI